LKPLKFQSFIALKKYEQAKNTIIVGSRHDIAHLNKMMATKACRSFAMVMTTTNVELHCSNFLHIKNDKREQDDT
jgi:hypothetical protein